MSSLIGRRVTFSSGAYTVLAPALLVLVLMLLPVATMRYAAEWCMPWVITGALIAMWIDQRLETTASSIGFSYSVWVLPSMSSGPLG